MNRIRMILFVATFVAVGCGGEVSEQPPGQTAPPDDTVTDADICFDTCQFANDGVCDDGGSGSAFFECDFGTDCSDCGPRDETQTNADICGFTGFCCVNDGFCEVPDCPEPDPDCEFCGIQDGLCVLLCAELDADCTNADFCEGLGECCSDDSRCDEDCPEPDSDCKVNSDEDIQNATWIVIAVGSDGPSFLTATAFGVAPDMLATNAHVAQGIIDLYSTNSDAVARVFQHETGDFREITTVWAHPDYAPGTTTPDVGLLKVDEEIPNHLALADADVLQALDVFDEVSLCGFPGSVTIGIDFANLLTTGGDFRPRATCLRGTISALRPFDPSDAANPENTFLIQYGISTEPGVSGGAVFDKRGEVIGVHAWGLSSEGEQNFAIRSDKLAELMAWADQGQVKGVILSDIEPQFAACTTTYYSSELGFGFDLPSTFEGPFLDDFGEIVFVVANPSTSDEEATQFFFTTLPLFPSGLEESVASWIELRSEASELLALEEFTASNGQQAFLMLWRRPGPWPQLDIFEFESWTAGPAGAYILRGRAFRDDFLLKESLLETAVRTICVDPGRVGTSVFSSSLPATRKPNVKSFKSEEFQKFIDADEQARKLSDESHRHQAERSKQ